MATVLSLGDIAIVQYNSGTTDSFSFIFARDIEAGTVVNFTDNGWLAAGGFRAGDPLNEGTVTYTAPPGGITAGTVITLTGLNLDDAGDQIIAYQGTQASPTILYLVDLADGNNTVAGDATNDNTTALPPGLTLGVNAVAVPFDNAIYAGPIDGFPPQLFPLIGNSANWIDGNALPPSARYFYPPHLDLDSNNSTSGGDDYRADIPNNSTPVPIADTDTDIDDFDGGFITAAQIDIKNQFPGDVLSVSGTLPFGIFASPFDPATGILNLFGFASHSAYQTAIEQIRFSTDAPVGVTKSIAVWVFDDFWWSNEGTAIFTVTSAAAPPVLDLDANNSNGGGRDYVATFTTNGPAIPVADTDVSITDPDSTTIQSARITLAINRQSGDALSAGALPPGITASSYNSFTGVITLSGAASLADYQTALRQVVFDTTSLSTADRIINVTVNDGTSDSNVGTTFMHVVLPPPNVPPALDLDADNSTTTGANYLTTFTDGGPPVAIVDADVSVIDIDSPNLASATVTLTNGDPLGSLTFNGTAPGGIVVSGSTTHVITLTGAASAADYQAALRQITFNNTDTNPSTETRVIDIVVNDGAHNSNTAQALIQVEVVNNSAPVLDLDANDSSGSFQSTFRNAFTENGAPVPIADVDTTISDADSSTISFATITLANPQTGDLLTVSGTLPAAITAGYDPGTGILVLAGTGTHADYATALSQIHYSNTSEDPVAGDRLIEVVVNDGVNDSNLAVSIISVTATNDAPVITVDPSAAYVENAAPVVLAPLATLSDVDDTELHGALVSITAGSFPGDGDILSVGGITSNTVNGITFTWMPAQHALIFSGASSVANYLALLQQVQFQSSSDNPTDFSHSPQRTLTWAVTDNASVTTATSTINIGAVNDGPLETVDATAAYTENGSPVVISPNATASDVDSSDLIYGEVRIVAGGFDGDVLTVNGQLSGTFDGINFSYDAALQRLLFESPAAAANYQALMRAVQFESTSENPTNFGANPTRTLGWGLSDGENYSSPATTTQITITALNDAPINTVPGEQTVAEDAILPIVGVSVADIDSSALTTTLSVAHGILNVTAGPGVTGSGTASVTITGTAAQINAALVGLAYTGNLNFNGADTLTVATNDGTATDTDTIAIAVNAVNDPPALNLDANSSTIGGADYLTAFTDGGPAVAIVDTDVSVVDPDSPLLASATVTLTNPQALDRLTFTGPPPGSIIVAGSGTSAITLTGAASAADYQTALRQITFDNPDTNPSTETRIIDVVVNDGTAASNIAHAFVEVTQVNNSAPTLDLDGDNSTLPGTSYRTTFTENGTPVAIADTDTVIGDPDIGSTIASATITLKNPQIGDLLAATLPLPGGITASAYDPVTGTLTLSNVASLATYETALEAIRFSSAGDNPVAGTRIIQVVVNDGIHGSQPATSLVKVVAVNDAPINTVPGAQTVAEDTTLPIAGVSVADVDSSALTTTLSVAHGILNVTAGAGVTGNGTASVTITGTAAQINTALAALAYTGNLNFNGADTLTIATSDGTAADIDTIAITVNAVNDAPVNTVPAAQTVAEDTILPIAGVSVADVDSSALTTTLSVAHGILNVTAGAGVTGNGTASVTIAGTAAQINAALAGLAYTGNLNFNGADTLTVATSDGTATDTDTIAITVNAVNDAPVNTVPAAQTVAEDTILPIAGVSVADIDSSTLTTTLSVAHGILNVTAGAGVTGNGTGSVTVTGTAVQINTALAGLAYTGNLNFNGADTLTVATSDGTAADIDTIAITVNAVNDAPVNTVPATQTVAEDTTLPIAGVSVADIDSSALTTTLSVAHGILNVTAGAGVITGNGTASVTIAGTAAQINTALAGLAYTGNLNFNGADTLTVATNDGAATDTDTIAITVNAVNDAPVNTVPAAQTVAEDTTLPIAGVSVADIDSSTLTTTLSVAHGILNVTAGAGVTGNGTGSVTVTGTAAQINTALAGLAYTGNLNFNGADTLTVATSDGTAADIDTIAITVNAVNDAPVNTVPAAQTVAEDTTLPIAGVSVADVDSSALTTTLSVAHGILNVTAGAGVTGNGTASVTIAGTAAQINAALAGLAYTGNLNFNGADTLTVATNDGAATDTDTIAITVNAVNDAPVNTVPAAQTVAEDTILPIAGVSVADIDSTALTTLLSVAHGTLNVTAGAGVITGNGTATVTIAGTAAQINTALAGLTYTGNLNFNGADTLRVATIDGTAADIDTIAITVNAVNDPPALNLDANSSTIGGVDYLTTFTGSAVAIVDTDVSVVDTDSPTLASATVTLTNPQALDRLTFNGLPPGSISVSGSGTSVITLTSTGAASAADYQTALQQIRFENTGTTPSTETRIIDVVVNDGTADSNIAHSIVEVIQVNAHAPTVDLDGNNSTLPGTNYHTTFTENGTAVAIADTDTLIGDPDIGSTTVASATITLTNAEAGDTLAVSGGLPGGITASAYDPATGTLTLSGVASFANYEAALEAIRFSSAGDNPVAGNRIIEVVVNDGVNDSQPAISLVTVVAVNDAPALAVAVNATYQENGAAVSLSPALNVTDADDTELNSAAVQITAGSFPGDGDTLTVGGDPSGTGITFTWNPTLHALVFTGASSVANYQTLLRTVQFQSTSDNPTDFNASPQRTLTWLVSDGTAVTTATTTLDIVAVNDAPVNTVPAAQTVAEDTILPIAGVSVADVDSSALTTTLSVAHGTLHVTAGAGVITGNGTGGVTITGTAAQINTALAGLAYAGNPDFNGADTLTVATNDGTATDTDTIAITVNAVNDAPVNTVPAAQTVAEDAILPIAGVSVADVDSSTLTTTLSVAHGILNVTAGPGVTGNGTASVTITGTAAQINTALAGLAYTGNLNFNGADTLTVATSDGTAADIDTIAITVNAVNDAPVNTVPAAQTVAEDTILPIAGVSVADVDSSALTTTLSVAHGILNVTAGAGVTGNGTASVTIAGTAAQINAALAGLAYTGNLNFNGADTLTVATSDGTATDTDTIAITVNAVNDAPVNTVPAAQTVAEDTILPIAGVSVADIDSSTLTTTLSVAHGILNVTAGAGVTGNGTGSVTVTGTAAQINTALAGLAYTGNLNFNGADTLTVATSEGTAADIDTIAITVNAVNDAPVNTVPATQTVAEDTTLPIAGVSVADIDSSALTTTLSVAHGILNVTAGAGVITGNGTASVTIAGTAAQINTALAGLAYTGNLNFNGADTLTVATNDGAATDTDTIAITVNAVNDAPVNTVPAAQTVAEDTILPITGVSVADIDSSTLTTLLSVAHGILNVTAGAGVTGNGTGSVTIAGTAAQINTALAGLAYTGNLNFNGADTLTVATNDGTAADIDTIAITVNAVNDPPALNLDANGSTIGGVDYLTTFTGSAVAIVDTDVSVVDTDSPLLASATVTLTNPQALDSLTFNGLPPGSISVAGSGTSVITLTGAGSAADYQAALQQIKFDNTGTNPSTETRIIDVVVNDGTAASNIAHAFVEVTQVNISAPTLDLDGDNSTLPGTSYRTTFTENGTAVAIADTDTLISDPDIGSTIASATITLTNAEAGDTLAVSGGLPGGITASAYDPATGTLTLSNVASFADYETALEAIRFSSAGGALVAGNRIIQVVVNDGIHDSQPAISFVRVVAGANDAPALVVADATYQENAAAVSLSPALSVTDPDDTELNSAAVQITAGSFPGDGDILTVNGATSGMVTGITFTWNPALHALVLTGASLVANYQALLQTVQFHSTSDNPTDFDASPQRTLTWLVSDGAAITPATTTLDIVAVNDAPVNTVPGAQTLAEDTNLPIAGVSVADIDSSALTTTLSVAHGILNVTDGPGVTGNGSASVIIAGTAAQINTALAGLAYAGNPDFNGADTLTVATSDGTATDTDTIAITVTVRDFFFEAPTAELPFFGTNAGGWSSDNTYPREVADVNGDGMADIVGFGAAGVFVSLATGDGHFAPSTFELPFFGPDAGGWSSDDTYPREVADVNGDGMADIVGFGAAGVLVSLATGGGHFAPSTFELPFFGPNAGGWSSDNTYPREVADVNGDGMADIVGFGAAGVLVSLATGGGHFAPSTFELPFFGPDAGGWSSDDTYPREVADVNGDGMADIVGFGAAGVYVSLATGGGHFAPSTFDASTGGWSSDDAYPREVADVNGDGMADIVGFGAAGVWVSLATGGGHFAPATFKLPFFGVNTGGWSSDDTYPREVADVSGDGMADIVGFGSANVWVSLASDGQTFSGGPVNHTPVVMVPDPTVQATAGQTLQMANLFRATDADSDTLTYEFYDATAGGGHFEVNGVAQAANQIFAVTAADLANTTFVPDVNAADDLLVGASDGDTFSGWSNLHVDGPLNHAPVVMVPNPTVDATPGHPLVMSGLFNVTDVDSGPLTYLFFDKSAGGGHFEVNGVTQAANQIFGVTAAQLTQTTFVPAANASDDLLVGASDGLAFSGWSSLHIL